VHVSKIRSLLPGRWNFKKLDTIGLDRCWAISDTSGLCSISIFSENVGRDSKQTNKRIGVTIFFVCTICVNIPSKKLRLKILTRCYLPELILFRIIFEEGLPVLFAVKKELD
jgi:hypothetical protein